MPEKAVSLGMFWGGGSGGGGGGRGEEEGGTLIIWVKLFEQQGFTVDHPDGRHSRRATRAQVFRLLSNFFWEMPSNELPAGRFGPISL